MRVAFQGEGGAFSEAAIHRCFGEGAVEPLPCPGFADLADAVTSGRAGFGMLPVENSIAGGVAPSYDELRRGSLTVVGEVIEPIRLCLMGLPGASVKGLRRVLSHPVALGQCQAMLRRLDGVDAVAVHDTAGAARLVAEAGDAGVAAVASRRAASLYGLDVLLDDVQDRPDNQTRFFVVARPGTPVLEPGDVAPGAPGLRTALLLATAHRPGALADVLVPLAAAGLNLTRIESRPADEPWHYAFFLELDGDAGEPRAAAALRAAADAARQLHVLGSFHRLGS